MKPQPPAPAEPAQTETSREVAAEAITVRIRWFGLLIGYVLVNLIRPEGDRVVLSGGWTAREMLNVILTMGAVYALIDTWFSYKGRVFLRRFPLVVALMETTFIGLLCHFDGGVESPFRYYYFLSLLVFAFRYPSVVAYTAWALHAAGFSLLAVVDPVGTAELPESLVLMLVLMGWVTWAGVSLAALLNQAGLRMQQLNERLRRHQAELERRIEERTRELQQSQALLVQQEKQAAFGLLAAGIAHEVGNPLAAISSLVQMLKRHHEDEYTRQRLQMVDDQLRRIQRTLRELVDFSRPASTEEKLCDVHEIIEEALNIAKYYKRKKGRRIITRFADELPRLRAVRDQLVQVFLNLIINALDATEEGGTIEIDTELKQGWIHVTVRDDGNGIRPEDRERIFQPYFTTKPTGTGLGLFVCRHILERTRGGRIELTHSDETGTTWSVYLTCDLLQQQNRTTSVPSLATERVHELDTIPP